MSEYEQPDYDCFVGIDTGRYSNTAVMLDSEGNKLDSLEFPNDQNGCNTLIQQLSKKTGSSATQSVVGVEGTGVCSNILLNQLSAANYTIKSITPISAKRHRDYFTQDVKDDEHDAYVTADYLRLRYAHLKDLDIQKSKHLSAIKELSMLYKDFAKQKTAYINMLHQAVMEVFPQYITKSIFSKINCKSSLVLLSELPTPKAIVNARLGKLKSVISKASRNRIKPEKIKRLYAQAASSYSDTLDYDAPGLRISALARMILHLQQEQDRIKKLITRYLKHLPEAEILLSLPGIGVILCARLLSAIGSIDRFHSSDALALYCGVACLNHKSGKRQYTKRANRVNHKAKDAIMQIAHCSIHFNPASKAFYDRKCAEGKRHWQAIKALARNIIRVIYAMLKNNRMYEPRSHILPETQVLQQMAVCS